MHKKIISLIFAFTMLVNLVASAMIYPLSIGIFVDEEKGSVCVSGTTTKKGTLSIMITDPNMNLSGYSPNLKNIYAVTETPISADGKYSAEFQLPDTLAAGQYRVVIGGMGDEMTLAQRSKLFDYHGASNYYLWLEGENATTVSGGYKIVSSPQASNGAKMVLDTTDTQAEHRADYQFDLLRSGNYDIWVLSTPGNVEYVSKYQWKTDNSTYKINENAIKKSIYSTDDSRQTGVHWSKLTTQQFTTGTHTLSFICPEMRSGYKDFYYHVLDSILIVPHSWEWEPMTFEKPFGKSIVQGAINKTFVNSQTITRGKALSIMVSATLNQKPETDLPLFAAIYWKGEMVAGKSVMPRIGTSNWTVGKEYSNTVTVTPPEYAPDGEYSVVCGVGYPNYQIPQMTVTAATVKLGTQSGITPEMVSFSKIIPTVGNNQICVNATMQGTANGKVYMKLWKKDVLWGICETEVSGQSGAIEWNFPIPDGIPDGNYQAEIGVYGKNLISEKVDVNIKANQKYGYKPLSNGVYIAKKTGKEHFWYVNQQGALIWDGKPYIPMGGMECPTLLSGYSYDNPQQNQALWAADLAVLQKLRQEGIQDLYLNPVRNGAEIPKHIWQFVLDKLDEMGFRYGIQYGSDGSVRSMDLYYIRANSSGGTIKKTGVTASGTVVHQISPNAYTSYGSILPKEAEYVVVDAGGVPVDWGNCKLTIQDSKLTFTADVNLKQSGTHTVYFTPKVQKYTSILANFWDNGDIILQDAKTFSQKLELGDGFRNIIDPIANESGFYNELESIRPTGTAFETLYQNWLQQKYGTTVNLNNAWKTNISDFAVASRLIPLYTTPKAEQYSVWCIDPTTNQLYKADGRNGILWNDFLEFRDYSFAEFNNQVADAFKSNLNVPIVVKNVWGHKEYFKNSHQVGGLDGLGVEAYGDLNRLKALCASTYGMTKQFAKTAWLIVTETSKDENVNNVYESGKYGYESESYMNSHFDTLYQSGVKGVYDFLFSARHNEKTNVSYSYITNPLQFDWAKNYRAKMNNQMISTYEPNVQKLYVMPYAYNYYTAPNQQTAVLYPDSFTSIYQAQATDTRYTMLTQNPFISADVLLANFENGPASDKWGKPFGEMITNIPKEKKVVYAGLRRDIGTVPELDSYFTNEFGVDAKGRTVQILNPSKSATVLAVTTDGRSWAIRDGNLWILACEKWCSNYTVTIVDEFDIFNASTECVTKMTIHSIDNPQTEKLIDGKWNWNIEVNNSPTAEDTMAIIAFYDTTGNLIRIEKTDAHIEKGNTKTDIPFMVKSEDMAIKTFLWKTDMTPISDIIAKTR